MFFLFSLTNLGKEISGVALGRVIQAFTISSYKTGTVSARFEQWEPLIADIQRNPLIGQGALAYRKYRLQGHAAASENVPLEIFHSAGLIGFLSYFWLHVYIFVIQLKRRNRNWLSIALAASILSFSFLINILM